jgi:hypothetical protein
MSSEIKLPVPLNTLIYRINTLSNKIPATNIVEINKLILNENKNNVEEIKLWVIHYLITRQCKSYNNHESTALIKE